ncbi:MAG: MBL fold metallo-hydrolase [Segetibacter sp.]
MINVFTIKNSFFSSNTYLISQQDSRECLVIDPGLDKNAIQHAIDELNVIPSHILSTHGHFDHTGSVHYLQHMYNAPFYIHEQDSKILRSINFFLKIMKIDMRVEVPVPDQLIQGKKADLVLGNFHLSALNFPGHTEGSCLLLIDNVLFTGDTLYSKGLGMNPFPGQDKEKLRNSLNNILTSFTENLMIYPGHGSADTLNSIKAHNKELIHFLEEVSI